LSGTLLERVLPGFAPVSPHDPDSELAP